MSTPHAHMLDQVRKQPGSMPAIRYPACARHTRRSIWSKSHHSNWHLSATPVHATLSRGDRPRSRSREQASFT
jgi:hypothetical protein